MEAFAVSAKEKAEALNDFFCSTFTDEDLSNLPRNHEPKTDKKLDSFTIAKEVVLKKLQ